MVSRLVEELQTKYGGNLVARIHFIPACNSAMLHSALYRIRLPGLKKSNPMLLEYIGDYLFDEEWVGILFSPAAQNYISMLMDENSYRYVKQYFADVGAKRNRPGTF